MLHPSFNFFKIRFGIKIDPQLESATQPKARGLLHMECNFEPPYSEEKEEVKVKS
jgi:hypothetical protein